MIRKTRKWFGRIEMIKTSRNGLNDEDKICRRVMNVMERRCDVEMMWTTWLRGPRPRLVFVVFECFDFFGFLNFCKKKLDFYVLWFFLGFFFNFEMQNQTRKYVQGKCVSNTQECQTHQQSYKGSTRMYKDKLKGVFNIRKVSEAKIYRWKKRMPHSRGGDGNSNLLLHFPTV